ncbi:MAG TPA: bifunctional metallophosphatase/5'-nucleotidase, partial [Anaerolineae bacterium]|nr:bifunctional metallophosphatase/5'-nucleotidase [Anaerolineae bacterium]
MHGDFLAEVQGAGGRLVGGLALLSGYINRVRREEENVIYAVSGDMLQGSVIDSEYRG